MNMSITGVKTPAYRQRLGYHSMVLGGICAIVATLIILGNRATETAIEQALARDKISTLAQVLPKSLYNNNLLADTKTIQANQTTTIVHIARQKNTAVAVAFPIVGYGYSGAINMILGIDNQGKILGVRVINHAETPGLGDKIEINKDDWIKSFDGHSLQSKVNSKWAVKKDGGDFDQFTGATITPRAVVSAVFDGLLFFQTHKNTLLAPPEITEQLDSTSAQAIGNEKL